MSKELKNLAVTERQMLKEHIGWFAAGARLLSPSGDDITAMKVEQLKARLEHVQNVLSEGKDAART